MLAALVAVALAAPVRAAWQETRVDVVDPIHELLHHTYPDALQAADREGLATLFGAGAEPGALEPSLALLGRFARIEHARAEIDRVDLEAEPVRAWVNLALEGRGVDGAPLSVLQTKDVALVRADDGWRILDDRPGPVRIVPVPPVRFVDETERRGLAFEHRAAHTLDLHGAPQRFVHGSGVAAVDVDTDGWPDAVLASGDRLELFLNREGTFARASEAWGLGRALPGVRTVVLPVDVDGDGRRDLFLGSEYAQPLLLRNTGSRFEPVAGHGIRTTERTIAAVAADFDGDGSADLFLANHEDVFREAPDPPGSAENAEADQLFLNDGHGRFRDATAESGIDNTGWSLAPAVADYDLDGDVDLFVGNDFGTDVLYRNDGRGRFDEVSRKAGVTLPVASMSADWGDFDADGDLDLFVGGMRSGSGWVLEVPDFPVARVPRIIDALFRPHVREAIRSWFRGNRFYENLGDGTFREIAQESGAANSGWAWGSVWLDFDNDGRLDVYGANGFISGPLEDDV